MSTPAFPRIYRFNTNNGVIPIPNSVPGVSSGRWGDFIIDDLGNLYYYSGVAWLEVSVGGGAVYPPENQAITLQPTANALGAGYSTTISGGDATVAGNGGFLRLTSGTSAAAQSGNILIDIPASQGTSSGSSISLTAGNAAADGGIGGDIMIYAGSSTVGNGGDIDIAAGTGILDGILILRTAFTVLQRLSVQSGLELRSENAVVVSDIEATLNGVCGVVTLSENVGASITINNTYIQGTSIVLAQIVGLSVTSTSTQILRSVVPAAGSVVITTNAAPGAGEFTRIAFLVITPII